MNNSVNLLRYPLYVIFALSSVFSFSASAATNVALNKTVTASSVERSGMEVTNATDGNTATRWSSTFSHSNWIAVDLGSEYKITGVKLNWEAAFGKGYQIQTSNNGTTWTTIYTTTTGDGGIDDLVVSGTGRYLRMNGTSARKDGWGYSLWELEVYGTAAVANPTNVAFKKSVTASTVEKSGVEAAKVNDGNTGSRWASSYAHDNWVAIDLGASYKISRVLLNWEAAYGKAYKIQTSTNGTKWNTIYATVSGNGNLDDLTVSATGRYIRMYGVATRANGWGYSLWEFEVYGVPAGTTGSSSSSSVKSSSSSSSVKSSSSSSSSVKSSSSSSSSAKSSSVSSSSSSSVATGSGAVTLEWYVPTARENGVYLELDDIGGYEIRYKKSTDSKYTVVFIEEGSTDSYTIGSLSGTYEFSIATFDSEGIYSDFVPITPN